MTLSQFQVRIGEALLVKRLAAGFSQEQFSECMEMHRTYYSAIEAEIL